MTGQADPASPAGNRRFLERLLSGLDRVPGFGGGRTQAFFLAAFFLGCLSIYLTVLKVRGPAASLVTHTAWDDYFPFILWWVWLYLLPYVLGPMFAAAVRRDVFAWYIRRGTLIFVVSMAVFVALPTRTSLEHRQEGHTVALGDGPTARLYRTMIEIDDPPANAAPSLHVSLSCLLAWAMAYSYPRWWLAALAASVVVWLSTLYTRQHHLLDVLTGALLASVVAVVPPRPTPSADSATGTA
jgi:membrane-associated phospholipid phosphatase